MNKNKESLRIFTGSSIIAQALTARLNELDINPILRNDHESSIQAGFAASIADQVMVFIRKDEMEKAQNVIDTFLNNLEV